VMAPAALREAFLAEVQAMVRLYRENEEDADRYGAA